MAIVPFEIERKYADIAHSDSSRYLRGKIRALWGKGQQLWDSDINKNWGYWSAWMPMTVIYRRDQKGNKPPFYSPTVQKYIIDPKWAVVPDGGEDLVYYFSQGMLEPIYYKPLNGAFAWVQADKMLVAYSQNEWRAAARLGTSDSNVEIAIYAKGVKRLNRPFVASHVVGQPFKLVPSGTFSRARGVDKNAALPILKNGVQVASVYKSEYSSGISGGGVTFNTGDILSVQIPAEGSIGDEIMITIIGSLV